jgi:hypothetical protein
MVDLELHSRLVTDTKRTSRLQEQNEKKYLFGTSSVVKPGEGTDFLIYLASIAFSGNKIKLRFSDKLKFYILCQTFSNSK